MPGRGQYDRSLSPAQRWTRQRQRVLEAVADALEEDTESAGTVARVARLARVGRNTFYAHFKDFSQARRAAEERAERAFALLSAETAREAVTPRELLRRVAALWVNVSRDARFRILFTPSSAPDGSAFERLATRELERIESELNLAGVASRSQEPLRRIALAGAVSAILRAKPPAEAAVELVVDLVLRALR